MFLLLISRCFSLFLSCFPSKVTTYISLFSSSVSLVEPANMTSNRTLPQFQKPKRRRYNCFIWPRESPPDLKFSKSRSLPTWLDIFTGKGPDIFIGDLGCLKSYSRKETLSPWGHTTACNPVGTASFLPCCLAPKRLPSQLYDFRKRKYREWTPEWHPLDYPCAYCCSAPCVSCKHGGSSCPSQAQQSKTTHLPSYYAHSMLEPGRRRRFCDACCGNQMQEDKYQHPSLDISNYRCY